MRFLPLLAVGGLLTCGCGAHTGGDPGDKRLHELGNDRIFAALPTGASSPALTRTRARHVQPAFSGAGWDGPSVVTTFAWSGPPRTVFRFFADRAAAAGWRATANGALHMTDAWAKRYPDGAAATLLLSWRPVDESPKEHTFVLLGSISLPD